MSKITRESLLSLEAYHKARTELRGKAIEERRLRSVRLGEHLNLIFESESLMRYQIQEMLRVEKIFEDEGIQDELDAYNPLVPDGSSLRSPGSWGSKTGSLSKSRVNRGSMRLPTRILSAPRPTRHRRCISCASN